MACKRCVVGKVPMDGLKYVVNTGMMIYVDVFLFLTMGWLVGRLGGRSGILFPTSPFFFFFPLRNL